MNKIRKTFKNLKTRSKIIAVTSLFIIVAIVLVVIFKRDDSYAMKVKGRKISPEVYNAYIIQKTLLAQSQVTDPSTDLMEQKIDDTLVPQWIKTEAEKQIIYDTVIKVEFEKEKLKVGQTEEERLNTYLAQQWEANESTFKSNNCDKEAFNKAYERFLYKDLVFEHYVSENLLKEEDVEISKMASTKYFVINKYSLDGKKYTKEEVDQLIKLAETYVKDLKNKKSIDEVYQSYLDKIGEDISSYRPISLSTILEDNEAYTSKVPNFVKALMKTKVGTPLYVEDDYYITVGIREKDTNQKAVGEAYVQSARTKVEQENFDKYIDNIIKKATIKTNDKVIKKYSPEAIKISEPEEE